jgi:hypothetical protein
MHQPSLATALALAAAVLALAAAPAVDAQTQPEVSLTVEGLSSPAPANGTAVLIPVEVTFGISGGACATTATYHVELTAAVSGQTAGNASLAVEVVPDQLDFTFGPPQTFVGASQTHGAALHVTRVGQGVALNGTATVAARVASMSGCGPTAFANGFDTQESVDVAFTAAADEQAAAQAMPGLAPPTLLAGLAGLVLLLRRRT